VSSKDGRDNICKICTAKYRKSNIERNRIYKSKYYIKNKDRLSSISKEYSSKLRNSLGVGIYIAEYPSGKYIGSGKLYRRRRDHLTGHTRIGKSLNEKAISFKIVKVCETKEESLIYEQKVIDWYGLHTLLNTINVGGY
jgi:hypothetical protein